MLREGRGRMAKKLKPGQTVMIGDCRVGISWEEAHNTVLVIEAPEGTLIQNGEPLERKDRDRRRS